MKKIEGIVQLRGDHIVIDNGNNEEYVIIDGVSTYDFNSVIMNQSNLWKIDLIKDLFSELELKDIKKVSKMVSGLYCKEDLERVWDSATIHSSEVRRIKDGESMFSTPMSDSKEKYFKHLK